MLWCHVWNCRPGNRKNKVEIPVVFILCVVCLLLVIWVMILKAEIQRLHLTYGPKVLHKDGDGPSKGMRSYSIKMK